MIVDDSWCAVSCGVHFDVETNLSNVSARGLIDVSNHGGTVRGRVFSQVYGLSSDPLAPPTALQAPLPAVPLHLKHGRLWT